MGFETIDAHHHLWRYTAEEYGWIDDSMATLQRDFLPEQLATELAGAGVRGSIAVQARQTAEETRWLLAQASRAEWIRGVVGWMPIAEADFDAELMGDSKLVGLRHVVQGEAAGFLEGTAFNRGMEVFGESGLVYDLLIQEGQLAEAIRFVDRHPQQRFVLDHLAKPRIAAGEMEPWATLLLELGRREHVSCKVSGMVTEAHWERWSLDTLRPYLDVALQAFGAQRLMAGSDWPVCLVATSYSRWWQALREYFGALTETEQANVFGLTAKKVYGLHER